MKTSPLAICMHRKILIKNQTWKIAFSLSSSLLLLVKPNLCVYHKYCAINLFQLKISYERCYVVNKRWCEWRIRSPYALTHDRDGMRYNVRYTWDVGYLEAGYLRVYGSESQTFSSYRFIILISLEFRVFFLQRCFLLDTGCFQNCLLFICFRKTVINVALILWEKQFRFFHIQNFLRNLYIVFILSSNLNMLTTLRRVTDREYVKR